MVANPSLKSQQQVLIASLSLFSQSSATAISDFTRISANAMTSTSSATKRCSSGTFSKVGSTTSHGGAISRSVASTLLVVRAVSHCASESIARPLSPTAQRTSAVPDIRRISLVPFRAAIPDPAPISKVPAEPPFLGSPPGNLVARWVLAVYPAVCEGQQRNLAIWG